MDNVCFPLGFSTQRKRASEKATIPMKNVKMMEKKTAPMMRMMRKTMATMMPKMTKLLMVTMLKMMKTTMMTMKLTSSLKRTRCAISLIRSITKVSLQLSPTDERGAVLTSTTTV